MPDDSSADDLLRHQEAVQRLLRHDDWRPTAEAAIAYFTKAVEPPAAGMKGNSTWQQVAAVYEDLIAKDLIEWRISSSSGGTTLNTGGFQLKNGDQVKIRGEDVPRTVTHVSGSARNAWHAYFKNQGYVPKGLVEWRVIKQVEDNLSRPTDLASSPATGADKPQEPDHESVLRPKAPKLAQEFLWVLLYGRKHWKLLTCIAVVMFVVTVLPYFGHEFSIMMSVGQDRNFKGPATGPETTAPIPPAKNLQPIDRLEKGKLLVIQKSTTSANMVDALSIEVGDKIEIQWTYPVSPAFIPTHAGAESDSESVVFEEIRQIRVERGPIGTATAAAFFRGEKPGKSNIVLTIKCIEHQGRSNQFTIKCLVSVQRKARNP